jgi:hypothetical protein
MVHGAVILLERGYVRCFGASRSMTVETTAPGKGGLGFSYSRGGGCMRARRPRSR